ncbi:hypothetical protein EXIGLDRAFT_779009, partial [Exidia glandulosa HHB12029]
MLLVPPDKTPVNDMPGATPGSPTVVASTFARHNKLWFEDGNVIICGKATVADDPPLGFRVHKSLLASQSFAWLDALTPSEHSDSRVIAAHRGVPVIHLDDDVASLEHLLTLLYSQTYLPSTRLAPWTETCDHIAGILRIATKYEMPLLCTEIVRILERDWPTTLDEWDDNERILQRRISQKSRDPTKKRFDKAQLDDIGPEPARIIALALECNVRSILPAAFYHLKRIYQHPKPPIGVPGPQHRTFVPDCLPAEALHALLLGRESIACFVTQSRFNVNMTHSTCCAEVVQQWWTDIAT